MKFVCCQNILFGCEMYFHASLVCKMYFHASRIVLAFHVFRVPLSKCYVSFLGSPAYASSIRKQSCSSLTRA
jgi:hypothetical protein